MTELHPWQEKLINDMMQGRELKLTMSGRRAGKSVMTQQAIDRLMRDLNSRPVEDLVLSEGRVHGSRYYCVEPVGGNWMEMETWCLDTYGNCGSAWDKDKAPEANARWYMNDRKFWFRNERDRNWFIMKWSAA